MDRIVCPTERVVNLYDPSILWYKINNFPGYEISNTGYLRSFKSAKKYPYGIILQYNHSDGDYFVLTDSNNGRYKLTYQYIWENLLDRANHPVFGYMVQTKCRNSRFGILPNKPNDNPDLESKRIKSQKTRSIRRNGENKDYTDLSFPSFNIPDTKLE